MQRKKTEFSQSAVEFALVLPLLLLVIFGMLEMGRLVFVYTAVLNASREAARYGAASGTIVINGTPAPQYTDCVGIVNSAVRVGFLANIKTSDVTIRYDQGPGTAATTTCPDVVANPGLITFGSRIRVTVMVPYSPMVPLVPLNPLNVTSTNARTLLGELNISGTAADPPTYVYKTNTPT